MDTHRARSISFEVAYIEKLIPFEHIALVCTTPKNQHLVNLKQICVFKKRRIAISF
jgi:hypothetical protein